MKKQDKKIIDDIEFLSQLMEKNNLKELEISDGKLSYKLKKNQNENKKNTNIKKVTDSSNKITVDQKSETSLKSPLVGTAYLSPEPGSKQFIEIGQNVKIGQDAIIGSKSLVNKNIPDNVTAFGIPCRVNKQNKNDN